MRNNWTRDELLLAFNLYCKIHYGQFNNRNKEVIALAHLINRTSGAVAYKLVNFVSLDPTHQLLGRKGAKNIGKLDKVVFEEFQKNFDKLFLESELLLQQKIQEENNGTFIESEVFITDKSDFEVDTSRIGEYRIRETKVRINQNYFRKLVMSNYTNGCCITQITIPELLVASHIKPWSQDIENRLNPANGLCLSATFDKAFDKGLVSIDSEYNIIFSSKLRKFTNEPFYQTEFKRFEGVKIHLPVKFLPDLNLLKFHRENIFQN